MTYRFGPFLYDAEQRVLYREGELVPLVPKALDTLQALLERRGRVVEKSQLMKLVWPDTHVEDVGLARNISLLRKALGDESDENPYIETVPRRGYRFAAQVATDEPAGPPPPPERQSRARLWRWVLPSLLVLAAAGLVYYEFYVPSRHLPGEKGAASLAVVPFECICPGMDAERYSRGFNDVLVAELAKVRGLEVVSPSTVRRYQRARISMAMMGRILGLEVLVEGTIQRQGERLRITTRLIDVHTGKLIWAETYDRPADDPGGTQVAVGRAVAEEAGRRLRAPQAR